MKKLIIPIALVSLTIAASSCKKQLDTDGRPSVSLMNDQRDIKELTDKYFDGISENDIRYMPQSDEEKRRAVMIDQITEVFKVMYEDQNNVKLVNAAIKSELYTDETILLKDLIDNNSLLKDNARFMSLTEGLPTNLDEFANSFMDAANNLGNPDLIEYLNEVVTQTGTLTSEVSVYFPYSEDYTLSNTDVTLVAAVADADAILGYSRGVASDAGGGLYTTLTTVNDDYAATTKPVHVIGVNGVRLRAGVAIPLADFPPGGDITTPGLPREVKQVYSGDVKCKKQYDALVSLTGNGGGSEIRFVKGDGYLKTTGGQVETSTPEQPNDISRKNIRKENWVNWTRELDSDWEANNHQIFIGIYEEDNRNTTELSFAVSTTTKKENSNLQETGTVTVKFTYKSDDPVIFQDNLNRDVFFVLNRSTQFSTCGMYEGWPKRNCNADVEFTLADRTLVP